MKPKHLTLRPAEVARFLRPSGLVVIPVKPHPSIVHAEWVGVPPNAVQQWSQWDSVTSSRRPLTCPLGGPGTEWVGREAWVPNEPLPFTGSGTYATAQEASHERDKGVSYKADFGGLDEDVRWRPARSMPDWASRIRKTTTRVELRRVRTITEAEAELTGIEQSKTIRNVGDNLFQWRDYLRSEGCTVCAAVDSFQTLFDSLNGRGAFDEDPYAWFVRFETTKGST